MQIDPIKPTLKAPGTKRLKLNFDEPLSNVAFNFNLRRYIMALGTRCLHHRAGAVAASMGKQSHGDDSDDGAAGVDRTALLEDLYEAEARWQGAVRGLAGRGLHSSTSQLNLSRC